MRLLAIALDCDGFLANFCAGVLPIVEEVTGKKFDVSAITEHDFTKALGLSPHEASLVKKAIGARRGFAASLPRYPQARQGVRRLRTLGSVFCVTTPWKSNCWWRAEREAWLALHFGIDRVHHADNNDKTSYEADVFVDDTPDHVRDWLAAWPGRTAVLWRNPQNARDIVPRGAHETASWEHLYQIAKQAARRPLQETQALMETH